MLERTKIKWKTCYLNRCFCFHTQADCLTLCPLLFVLLFLFSLSFFVTTCNSRQLQFLWCGFLLFVCQFNASSLAHTAELLFTDTNANNMPFGKRNKLLSKEKRRVLLLAINLMAFALFLVVAKGKLFACITCKQTNKKGTNWIK